MKITLNKIKKLKPCQDRLDNFLLYYPKFSGSLKQFIELENVSYNDKVWVVTKLFNKKQNINWSLLCVESILNSSDLAVPKDKKLKNVIELTRKYLKNSTKENKYKVWLALWSIDRSANVNVKYLVRPVEFIINEAELNAQLFAWCATESAKFIIEFVKLKKEKELLDLMLKCDYGIIDKIINWFKK